MSICTWYREAYEPVTGVDSFAEYYTKHRTDGQVLEDWKATALRAARHERLDVVHTDEHGNCTGIACIVLEDDINLGKCCTVMCMVSVDSMKFMRAVLRICTAVARNQGCKYKAYTQTISRLEYRLKYMEV